LTKKQLNVGLASVNITPPIGVDLAGYSFGPSCGILDDLYAKTIILENSETSIVLITTDLIGFDFDFVERVREGIHKKTGVSNEHISLSASHTHSGPATKFSRKWGQMDQDYMKCLEKKLIGSVVWASNNLIPAKIGFGRGYVPNISNNRVYRWKYNEDRSIDPEVGITRIDHKNGNMMAILINFSCHPTNLHSYRNLISSDFPGFARRAIEKINSKLFIAYTNGAGGDITPIPYESLYHGLPKNLVFAQRNGTILGCEALKVAQQIKTTSKVDLYVKTKTVKLPFGQLPDQQSLKTTRDQARIMLDKAQTLPDQPLSKFPSEPRPGGPQRYQAMTNAEGLIEWAELTLKEIQKGSPKKWMYMPLQAIMINDLVLLGVPGEMYHETGLNIKTKSQFEYTYIITNANGTVGYIPTKTAFEINYPYEVKRRVALPFIYPFTSNVEEITTDAAVQLINSIKG
jgi:hypothetical protein